MSIVYILSQREKYGNSDKICGVFSDWETLMKHSAVKEIQKHFDDKDTYPYLYLLCDCKGNSQLNIRVKEFPYEFIPCSNCTKNYVCRCRYDDGVIISKQDINKL